MVESQALGGMDPVPRPEMLWGKAACQVPIMHATSEIMLPPGRSQLVSSSLVVRAVLVCPARTESSNGSFRRSPSLARCDHIPALYRLTTAGLSSYLQRSAGADVAAVSSG